MTVLIGLKVNFQSACQHNIAVKSNVLTAPQSLHLVDLFYIKLRKYFNCWVHVHTIDFSTKSLNNKSKLSNEQYCNLV